MTVWAIGGWDPSGGAGILRDRNTARSVAPAQRFVGMVTAFTLQGTGQPARSFPVSSQDLAQALLRRPWPRAVKLGLVPDPLVETVQTGLTGYTGPVVCDPVWQASDGGYLGASPGGLGRLAGLVTLLTPNRNEGAILAGLVPDHPDLLPRLACQWPGAAILLKDGHGTDPDQVVDRLWHRGQTFEFRRVRQKGPDVRGTGCALGTAIACHLAMGEDVVVAVRRSILWLDRQREAAAPGRDGKLHLPAVPMRARRGGQDLP